MKKFFKRFVVCAVILAAMITILAGCGEGVEIPSSGTEQNIGDTQTVTDELTMMQKTPTDINYSLERYNLIRRAYWVNGQREKARSLPCQIEKPLSYITLFAGNTIVESFIVDGKVSSLNSFLSPDYVEDRYGVGEGTYVINTELADVDGSYGENDNGIFFFTPDGKYVEWTGEYLYSDIPFEVEEPILKVGTTEGGN